MQSNQPTQKEWQALHEAAATFRALKCWEWMEDADLFGVQSPETGEIGYCCVLGNLGELFGLLVHRGSQGLAAFEKMESGETGVGDPDVFFIQHCLDVTFGGKAKLDPQDRAVAKTLGIQYKGKNVWPNFRSHRPGFVPWHLEGEEARFLTTALHQAVGVTQRFGEDPDMLTPPREGEVFVRVPRKEPGGIVWSDEWLLPPLAAPQERLPMIMDGDHLEAVAALPLKFSGIWEADLSYLPIPMREQGQDRPYFPLNFLCVDQATEFILDTNVMPHGDHRAVLLNRLLEIMKQTGAKPTEIWVRRPELFSALAPLKKTLGIQIKQRPQLDLIEAILQEMSNALMNPKKRKGFQ